MKDVRVSAVDGLRETSVGGDLRLPLLSNHPVAKIGLEIELAALRRALTGAEALRAIVGPARALAAYWIALEVACARAESKEINQKELAALAHGVWSQATISRAIQDLTKAGFVRTEANPKDRRSLILAPPPDVEEAFKLRGEATQAALAKRDNL